MKTLCPSCGSDRLEEKQKKHILSVIYGPAVEYDEIQEHCLDCDESGDFSGKNELQIQQAFTASEGQSMNSMLENLSSQGVTMAYLERALGLPARTVTRWKKGEYSAASIALLRTIRTYPWLLDVADADYDQEIAKRTLLEQAARVLHAVLKPKAESVDMVVSSDEESIELEVKAKFDYPATPARFIRYFAGGE